MDDPAKAVIPAVLYEDELVNAGELVRSMIGPDGSKVSPESLEASFRICAGALAMLGCATGQDPVKVGAFVGSIMAGIHVERRNEMGVAQEIAKA